jgi:hypothetical protein
MSPKQLKHLCRNAGHSLMAAHPRSRFTGIRVLAEFGTPPLAGPARQGSTDMRCTRLAITLVAASAAAAPAATVSAALWTYTANCTMGMWILPSGGSTSTSQVAGFPDTGGLFSVSALVDGSDWSFVQSGDGSQSTRYRVLSVTVSSGGSAFTQAFGGGSDFHEWSLSRVQPVNRPDQAQLNLRAGTGDQAMSILGKTPYWAGLELEATSGWSSPSDPFPGYSSWIKSWDSGIFTASEISLAPTLVPAPGAVALLGVAGVLRSRRRAG